MLIFHSVFIILESIKSFNHFVEYISIAFSIHFGYIIFNLCSIQKRYRCCIKWPKMWIAYLHMKCFRCSMFQCAHYVFVLFLFVHNCWSMCRKWFRFIYSIYYFTQRYLIEKHNHWHDLCLQVSIGIEELIVSFANNKKNRYVILIFLFHRVYYCDMLCLLFGGLSMCISYLFCTLFLFIWCCVKLCEIIILFLFQFPSWLLLLLLICCLLLLL